MVQERKSAFLAGEWTIEPELNALRRDQVERHIEPKVMKVLLTLASQQNHVFSKEEIISAVWPDTFVSDDALTRCISILRRITEDNPQAPRFIQTVPKVGYRLVAPVGELPSSPVHELPFSVPQPPSSERSVPAADPLDAPPATSPDGEDRGSAPSPDDRQAEAVYPLEVTPPAASAPAEAPSPAPKGDPKPRPGRTALPGRLLAGAVLLALVAVAALLWLTLHRTSSDWTAGSENFRTIPFTSYAGEQTQPAIAPDGRQVAFVRIAEDGSSRRIWLRAVGSAEERELNHDPGEQFSPAWAPDGSQIAFLARSRDGLGLYVTDLSGTHPARRVFIPQEPSHWEQGALSWSPDGKSLVFPDHEGTSPRSSILRLDLGTLRVQTITSPPAGWEGDLNPAFSPDGKRIAFTRASETAVRDIYWLSVKDGSVHQLTHDGANIDSLTWSRSGDAVLFSSNRAGKYALWRIAISGGAPQRLPVGTEDAFQPSAGPSPGELAYTQGSAVWSIDRISPGSGTATPVLSSTQQDSAPSLSPDSRWVAFQSRRSGNQEIWVGSVDGSSLRQLTSVGGPETGSPSWSHHGDRVLFDSRPDGHSHIFTIPAAGGIPVQLTFGNANDIVPRWSQDDRTVYFRSNRGGRWQLWKLALGGGNPQPITSGDGIVPQESADGKMLYYTRGDEPGLWRVPVGGGEETKVLPQPAAGYWGYFEVTPEGIYFLDRSRPTASLRRYSPASMQTETVAELHQSPPMYQGFTVGDDGKLILITGERNAGRHITLVEARP